MRISSKTNMMCENKVALIIIFNHRFDRNISILKDIYRKRFSKIFFLVPFYDGIEDDVIPVFENSYYFQGYIQQSLPRYYDKSFSHYVFIGDDLILNPELNESNLIDKLKLNNGNSYLPNPRGITESGFWGHNKKVVDFKLNPKGIECSGYLPSKQEALAKLSKYGNIKSHFKINQVIRLIDRPSAYKYLFKLSKFKFFIDYPLLRSYSDILIINSSSVKDFCYYSGIFSSLNLFVEAAIPTALALSTEKIITNKDISYKDGAIWSKIALKNFEEKHKLSIDNLLNNFPDKILYIHPVKLSKWKK